MCYQNSQLVRSKLLSKPFYKCKCILCTSFTSIVLDYVAFSWLVKSDTAKSGEKNIASKMFTNLIKNV